jgi:uncharacterized protein (DUF1015 family)
MPDFLPFCGYRFSPNLAERLPNMLAPPYDKISPQELWRLWQIDPLNAVRLVLPPPEMATGDFVTQSATQSSADWYAGARRFLDDWIRGGILRRDGPGYFFYRQDFPLDGRRFCRWGVIGALALTDHDETLPHEQTFEGPKADRFRLLKATQANVCSVFIVATDPQRTLITVAAELDQPAIDCSTPDGVRHRLYAITDQPTIQATRAAVSTSTLMIADGHHRYETARNYRAWVRGNMDPASQSPADAVMAYVCPMPQEGLVILPTHRVVHDLNPGWLDRLASQTCVEAQRVSGGVSDLLRDLEGLPETHVAVGATDGDQFLVLRRDERADPESYRTMHPALQNTDVMFLHHVILKHLVAAPEESAGRISYLGDPQEALALVKAKPRAGAFFLRPPKPEQVMEASRSGQRMPHKSTDFFPKIPTGLVIRLLREPPSAET